MTLHVLWGLWYPSLQLQAENLGTTQDNFLPDESRHLHFLGIYLCHNKGEFFSPFLWFSMWSWVGVELVILGGKAVFTDSTATPVCGPERWVYIGRCGRTLEEDTLQSSPGMGPLTPYCVGSLQEGGWLSFRRCRADWEDKLLRCFSLVKDSEALWPRH